MSAFVIWSSPQPLNDPPIATHCVTEPPIHNVSPPTPTLLFSEWFYHSQHLTTDTKIALHSDFSELWLSSESGQLLFYDLPFRPSHHITPPKTPTLHYAVKKIFRMILMIKEWIAYHCMISHSQRLTTPTPALLSTLKIFRIVII